MTTARTAAWLIHAVVFGPIATLLLAATLLLWRLTIRQAVEVYRIEVRIWRWRRARRARIATAA